MIVRACVALTFQNALVHPEERAFDLLEPLERRMLDFGLASRACS